MTLGTKLLPRLAGIALAAVMVVAAGCKDEPKPSPSTQKAPGKQGSLSRDALLSEMGLAGKTALIQVGLAPDQMLFLSDVVDEDEFASGHCHRRTVDGCLAPSTAVTVRAGAILPACATRLSTWTATVTAP